jgi:hypothetical protein
MDRMQLIKMLSWNISTEPEIEIDKVIDKMKAFPNEPSELIELLEDAKKKGVSMVDKYDMIKRLENL